MLLAGRITARRGVTPSALRVRLAEIGAKSPDGSPVQGDDVDGDMTKPLVPAAVLVPVIISDTPSILLTKRTSHLSAHAGQVSFPGGRIDPEDSGPEAAALREAWEEIGLEATSVQVLEPHGRPDHGHRLQNHTDFGVAAAGTDLSVVSA